MPGLTSERDWTVAIRAKPNDTLEIAVYDVIGAPSLFEEGITAKDFLARLQSMPQAKKIVLRVNSRGGVVDDAKAMINLLRARAERGAEIEAFVDGLAASSASYLLTAAKRVVMPANAFMMLHQVRTGIRGATADDLLATAEVMRRTNEQLAEDYAAASSRRGKKKTKEDFLTAFASGDTYLDADQAIEWGLADEKRDAIRVSACLADLSAFDDERLGALPEQLRGAPYVQLAARLDPPAPPAPQPTLPGPVARQLPGNGAENKPMRTVSLVAVAALLGMTAEAAEAAEEKDILDGLKKKLATPTEPSSVTMSGVKLLGVATEAEATNKVQELQRTQLAVLGTTGKATIEEALSAVLEWKAKAEQTDQLTKQVAQLTEGNRIAKRDAAIEKCSREGTLPPSRHEWARMQFATAEAVETFCAGMPKGFFASVNEPSNPDAQVALTDEEKRVCKVMGMSEETFLEQKKLDRNRAGAQVGA